MVRQGFERCVNSFTFTGMLDRQLMGASAPPRTGSDPHSFAIPGCSDGPHALVEGIHSTQEQFRQLGWLAVTAAGGTLLLSERGYVGASARPGIALFFFALAAATSFLGQDKLVDHLTAGRGIQPSVRAARLIASLHLGAGAGALFSIVFG